MSIITKLKPIFIIVSLVIIALSAFLFQKMSFTYKNRASEKTQQQANLSFQETGTTPPDTCNCSECRVEVE